MFWLLDYIVGLIPMFSPFRQVVRVIIAVAAVIALLYVLLSLVGGGSSLGRL